MTPLRLVVAGAMVLTGGFLRAAEPAAAPPCQAAGRESLPWRTYVTNCLDSLIEWGTDRYGPVHTAMLMSILDPQTRSSPENPLFLDTVAYYEEGRAHRRALRGSNFWYDQATIRVMYRVSMMMGNPKYARAADAYIDAVFQISTCPVGAQAS
jgi:hypothetical protein